MAVERKSQMVKDIYTIEREPVDPIPSPYTSEMQENYMKIAELLGLIMGTDQCEPHNVAPTSGAYADLERKAENGAITLEDLEQWTFGKHRE